MSDNSHLTALGYAGGGFLIIVYFLWENGPHHSTTNREFMYLLVVLAVLVLSTVSMKANEPALDCSSIPDRTAITYLEYFVSLYLTLAIFLNSIPDETDQLEGVPLSLDLRVSHSVLRTSRDVENLMYDVHASGRNSMKKLQIPNSLLPFFILCFFVVHSLMENDVEFKDGMQIVLYIISALFALKLLVNLFRLVFVNFAKRRELNQSLTLLATKENGLDYLLQTVNCALLVNDAPWSTLELLVCPATLTGGKKLSVTSKAILLDAFQKRGLHYSSRTARTVEDLILSVHGSDCTTLKNMTDLGGDYQNLYKLVYSDITNLQIRKNILDHFKTQADIAIERNNDKPIGVKILSDVDDTLYSSGGKFPAGCDKEYPKHQLYPGCLSFFRSLDKQGQVDDTACNLVFLSARPHAYKDVAEEHSYRLFKKLVAEEKMHSIPTLLPGQIKQGFQAMTQYPFYKTLAWKSVGELKFLTFENYSAMYPEYKYVFCGDDGQGDLLAGELMAERHPEKLLGVFIHRVVDRGAALNTHKLKEKGWSILGEEVGEPDPNMKTWDHQVAGFFDKKIFVTETYVAAASIACEQGLITPAQLYDTVVGAVEEFDDVRCMYPDRKADWNEAVKDLETDIHRAEDCLMASGFSAEHFNLKIPPITPTNDLFNEDSKGKSVKEKNMSRISRGTLTGGGKSAHKLGGAKGVEIGGDAMHKV